MTRLYMDEVAYHMQSSHGFCEINYIHHILNSKSLYRNSEDYKRNQLETVIWGICLLFGKLDTF